LSEDPLALRGRAFDRRARARARVESLGIGQTAALSAFAATLVDGAEPREAGAAVGALIAGTFGALAFLAEREPTAAQSVRRLDRALDADGLVVTAWEELGRGSRIGRLLVRRAAALVARPLPVRLPSPAFVGAPLAALALVLFSLSERPDAGARGSLRPPPGAVGDAAGSAEARIPDASRDAARSVESSDSPAEPGAPETVASSRRAGASETVPSEGAERTERIDGAGARAAVSGEASGDGSTSPDSRGSAGDRWSRRDSAGMMSDRSAAGGAGSEAPGRPDPREPAGPARPPRSEAFGWIGSEPCPVEYEELAERWLAQRAREGR